MENQVRHEFSLVGLQRTGTNYVEQVLRASLPDVEVTFDHGWKHAFRGETDIAKIGANVVIVARHPVLWLQSCLLNSAKDIKESRSEFFADVVDPVIGFAKVYNRFYSGWLEHARSVGGHILRYEDVLENNTAILNEVFSARYRVVEVSHGTLTVPLSIQLSLKDLKAIVERECSLPEDAVRGFWAHIDSDVAQGLSYTFEEINFTRSLSERQRARTAAYKLSDKPEMLTAKDFQLLLRVGKDTFQNDGLALGEIGSKLFHDGDVEGAFDWLAQSVQTILRNNNEIFRVEADSRLSDFLQLLSRTCLAIREKTLAGSLADRQRARAAAYKFSDEPDMLTAKDFQLLLRVGKDTFQNDGLALGEIGAKLFHDGDVEGAFDLLAQSVRTILLNDNEIFRVEAESELADFLQLLSRTCLAIRERTLEQLAQHYARISPDNGHSLADKEWNLCLCLGKLGKLDLAIDHANRAIGIAETVPTRTGVIGWWTHHLGDLLASAGRRSQAIEKFRDAAAIDPSDFRHHYALAHEYRRHKDHQRMFESLNEAVRLNPDAGDIIGFRATALREFDPGNPEILPLARRWVEKKPKNGSARFFLSDELAKAGDIEGAIEEARAAANCDPQVPWRHHHLAELLTRKSRWDKALAAIDEAIRLEPKRASHHHLRSEILLKIARLDEARSSAEKATQCEDAVPWHYHLIGHICVLLGDHANAGEAFEKAAALEPSNYQHPFRLAQVYRALQDRERTIRALEKAIRLSPNHGDVIGFKATALREFDPGNADILPLARRWVESKPNDGSARFFLSDELAKAGDVESAIEQARTAVSFDPKVPWRHHHLAELLTRESRWDQALAAIDEAIRLEPRRASHRYLRSEILLKMEKLEEALRSADKAARCEDAVPWHFHLLGHICALLGDHANAAQAFEKAATLEPSNYQHHFRLAQECRALRDRQRTLEALEKAIQLNPNNEDIIGFKAKAMREVDFQNPEMREFRAG